MIDEQLGLTSLDESSTNPKELFAVEDVEAKTELTGEQVIIIAKMKVLGAIVKQKYKCCIVEEYVNDFLKLQISKDRGSRKEFVSAFQSKNDERTGGLMDKVGLNLGMK